MPRGVERRKGSWEERERCRRWEGVGEMKSWRLGRGRSSMGIDWVFRAAAEGAWEVEM